MPYVTTDDDVQLYYEDAGSGDSVLFVPRIRWGSPVMGATNPILLASVSLYNLWRPRLPSVRST
ncbi:MAG: hypothetical protein CM1200mP41_12480 [Gammaproteobacteria bacterium]|nr:MAG: hypothetical protein CM1200mP41_12480 [Gammaproteobacteria bacterium]